MNVADRPDRRWLVISEGALLVAGLLLMSGAVLPLFLGPPNAAWNPQGYPAVQGILLIFYAIVGVLIASRWRSASKLASRDPLLWILIGWVLLSAIWSDAASLTTRRALALVFTSGVGFYLALRFDIEDQLRLIASTLLVAALLSVVTVVVWPDYGIDQEFWRGPAWRGVYTQKNTLARQMVLLSACGLGLALGARFSSRRWTLIAALAAAFPFLARSLTALIVTLVIYGVVGLLFGWRKLAGVQIDRWRLQRLSAVVALTAGVWIGVWYLQQLPLSSGPAETKMAAGSPAPESDQVPLLNRKGTVLARLELWQLVADKIRERPWLGYGYGAFWLGEAGPSSHIWSRIDWKPPSAHNGLLDVALGIGAIGLALMCAHLVKTAVSVSRNFRQHGLTTSGVWPILFFVFFILYNLPETSMLVQNTLLWPVYVALALSCAADD
jgi:O-antigen ligase